MSHPNVSPTYSKASSEKKCRTHILNSRAQDAFFLPPIKILFHPCSLHILLSVEILTKQLLSSTFDFFGACTAAPH